LLPGFSAQQINVVGNTSLAGAYLAMINRDVFEEVIHAAGTIEAIELNLDPAFEGRYIDHLSIG
ncbi:MAG: ASKHA domain-containing protein, partial [Phycisphaerales bacterium]